LVRLELDPDTPSTKRDRATKRKVLLSSGDKRKIDLSSTECRYIKGKLKVKSVEGIHPLTRRGEKDSWYSLHSKTNED